MSKDYVGGEKTSQSDKRRLRRKTGQGINQWLLKERYWWKVVDEKPPDPRGVLGGKPTPYDWGLQGRGSMFWWRSAGSHVQSRAVTCSHVQSRAVTCSAAEDVERVSYPNSSKNTIKIKRSSVLLSLFVSAVGWSSSLSFERLSGRDCRSSHWWRGVDSKRSRGRLVRMVLVGQADELSKVLDRWS